MVFVKEEGSFLQFFFFRECEVIVGKTIQNIAQECCQTGNKR
jgi:hypothetical protein